MFFIICSLAVFCVFSCAAPVPFRSFEDFNAALAKTKGPSGEVMLHSTTVVPSANNQTTALLHKAVFDWVSMVINVVLSIISSGGFFCICSCGIKYLRNGGDCKWAWFYPKSLSTYKDRKNVGRDMNMRTQAPISTISSPTSSSPPSPPS